MNNQPPESDSHQSISHVLSTLSKYRLLWITPMILGMVLSAVYVVVLRQETWSAKQSLIVRDDLLGQSFKPGRFDSIESMKSAQETILEIARKPQVIRNALQQLGPESKGLFGINLRGWPSEEVIEDVQGAITFTAPNGAEFGKTEVIVLNTKASTRDRSRLFIELLLNEIILKVNEVRSLRLQSMEVELIQARDAAMMALRDSKARQREMDQKLGVDVGAMTAINDSQSSDNTIKRDISQIRLEKRQVETELESLRTTLGMLKSAKENPEQNVNIYGDLSKSQPTLDALKKELVKSQKELAVMTGQYNAIHPRRIHAENSVEAMRQQIYQELDSSIVGLQNEMGVTQKKLDRLVYEMENLDGRLISLSSNRADSLTLIADLNKRTEMANNAQSDLAEIQGLSLAKNADLLTRVDEPQVSTKPDGLGKKATILAGGLGGLMLGLGLVMLMAPPMGNENDPSLGGQAENQHLDKFFDSQTFEKVVVKASAAAATATAVAVQGASNAKGYLMSTLEKNDPPVGEHQTDSPHSPAAHSRDDEQVATTDQPPASAPAFVAETSYTTEPQTAPVGVWVQNDRREQPAEKMAVSPAVELYPEEPSMDRSSIESTAASQLAAMQLAALKTKLEKNSINKTMESLSIDPNPASVVDRAFEMVIEESSPSELSNVESAFEAPVSIEPTESVLTEPLVVEVNEEPSVHEPAFLEAVRPVDPVEPEHAEPEPQSTIVVSPVVPGTPADEQQPQPVPARSDAETTPINSPADLHRRDPNVRPVDLAKTAEKASSFVRIVPKSPVPQKITAADSPRRPNPFLNNGNDLQSNDQNDVDGSIPERIRKLNESISRFSKRPKKGPEDKS